jgi:hypothetical protein
MSIYPRTITVRRQVNNAATGGAPSVRTLGYSGVTAAAETAVLAGLPASIQFRTPSGKRNNPLPADARVPGSWDIFISKRSAALGQIRNRDISIDDLSQRYQVEDTYWNLLGHKLRARLLEV